MKQNEQELKQFKEVKRGLLRNGEEVQYVVIEKSHDGRIANLFVGQWITTNAVKELEGQAELFKREQELLKKNELEALKKHYNAIVEEHLKFIKALELKDKLLELEIKYIKGEVTEEEYTKAKAEIK